MLRNTAFRSNSIAWACAALTACATAPSVQPLLQGPEFGLVKELSPEFASKADGWFTETIIGNDGTKTEVADSGLVYNCAGRSQEYFEFRESPAGGPPEIVSRATPSYFKHFDAETFPEEMLKAFSDRSAASNEDAIKNLPKLEPGSWPPFGLSDYLEFEDGWLVAYDIGEFGGALIWLPKEGDSYLVSDKNTSDLEQVGDVVYAAQGLDHILLFGGGIQVVKRGVRFRPGRDENGEQVLFMEMRWGEEWESYPAGSHVSNVAYHEGLLVGLTEFGLVVVGTDGVVRYNHPKFYDRRKVVQQAGALYIDQSGRVYVGGADMIGVYSGLPDNLVPDLYAQRDCDFTYGETPEERR